MAHSGSAREVEIKLPVVSLEAIRRVLRRVGFRVARRRVFETNTVFDTPELALRRAGSLLRVRETGGAGLLTFKGPAEPGRHKVRQELESGLETPAAAARIFERIGFTPVFRYEKYRTEFARAGSSGRAMLDETPIGNFLELEGPPRWIDRTARQLGFGEADYITASYGALYLEECRRRRIAPGDMVFTSRK
jgi:adenylate cyclase class 2